MLGVVVPMTLLGLSFAVLVAPLTASVMSSVDQTDEGLASGINNAASRIAQLAGVALAAGVASSESGYEALGYARACRPDANRELLVGQTLVGHTHGAARDAELSRQIPPGRQPRAGGKPPRLDGPTDRPVDLRGQRRPFSTIDVDGEGSHRAMVQPELQILVLFYEQGGTHLFASKETNDRGDNIDETDVVRPFRISHRGGRAKILIDPFLSDNPSWDKGWIGGRAGEDSTQGGVR